MNRRLDRSRRCWSAGLCVAFLVLTFVRGAIAGVVIAPASFEDVCVVCDDAREARHQPATVPVGAADLAASVLVWGGEEDERSSGASSLVARSRPAAGNRLASASPPLAWPVAGRRLRALLCVYRL